MIFFRTISATLFSLLLACDGPATAVDAGSDAGAAASCPRPSVLVAGSAETDALASAPARCGQPAHSWLRDPSLGSIVASQSLTRFSAASLTALVESQGVTVPEPLRYDTSLASITYVTQDRGDLVEATALVAWPRGLPEDAPDPDVVLFLHGSSGYADGCGPTHDPGSQLLAALLASLGWMVVAPDYLGLRGDGEPTGFPHPYLVGQATAIASLDAARAVLGMDPSTRAGLCTSGRVLVLGGSQGGHAALWVDRLAPYYARELELVGTVATVPPADAVSQIQRALTELVPATRSSIVFFGLAPVWYGAGDRLSEVLAPPLDEEATAQLSTGCDPGGPYSPSTLEEAFAPALLDAASRGELASFGDFGCMVRESSLVHTSIARIGPGAPSYAILFVLAEADPLVSSAIERSSAEALCAGGAPLSFLECEGAGHLEGTTWALPEIVEFARARFAGEPPGEPCSITAPVRCRGTPGG
ncbi:MAG: hypothetical protein M5U28_30615 [Sandaracinaceae bacterium]|nr:hypothetical protein [Sandaracinaceae bacterium]